jgi:hypothetical protein
VQADGLSLAQQVRRHDVMTVDAGDIPLSDSCRTCCIANESLPRWPARPTSRSAEQRYEIPPPHFQHPSMLRKCSRIAVLTVIAGKRRGQCRAATSV